MTLLDVDEIHAGYGEFEALHGVSLHVAEGETVAVIGANGAGKSTLLKVIAGLLPPTAGHVALDGERLDGTSTHRRVARGIALVPEGRRIFPSLTVRENLLVGGFAKRPGP
jgi:branched-chain amino acid transport system ATP-binding protein